MATQQFVVAPRAVARALGSLATLLVLVSLAGQAARHGLGLHTARGLIPLFDVAAEANVPTFFSVLLLIAAALLLGLVAALTRRAGGPHVFGWSFLSCFFLFLAFDESFQVHERLIPLGRSLLRPGGRLGIFYFAWTIPYMALVLALAIAFLRFMIDLDARARPRFLVAASLYVGGAIGFELIESRHIEALGADNLAFALMATAEEGLEMAGVIIFLWALLWYLRDMGAEIRFGPEDGAAKPACGYGELAGDTSPGVATH